MNNTQADDAQYIDAVMPVYNLIEYCDNYPNTSGILWQYLRDEAAVNEIVDFTESNAITDSFKLKEKITSKKVTMAEKMLK